MFAGARHDIAVSSVDPKTKAVMEACVAENEADKHASNLKVIAQLRLLHLGIPQFLRLAVLDATVSVSLDFELSGCSGLGSDRRE